MPKNRKTFFRCGMLCSYRIFYDREFLFPRQDYIQVPQIFFKGHWTKIDENQDHFTPPPKRPVLGGGMTAILVIFLVMS